LGLIFPAFPFFTAFLLANNFFCLINFFFAFFYLPPPPPPKQQQQPGRPLLAALLGFGHNFVFEPRKESILLPASPFI
jgi:hypothetical protein